MPTILIVEDEGLIAIDLEDTIKRELGTSVRLAASAAMAARALDHDHVDFVLLDVEVADGPTYELARRLRGLDVPFAFATAYDAASLPEDLRAHDRVSKPYRSRAVTDLIRSALDRANAREPTIAARACNDNDERPDDGENVGEGRRCGA